MRIREKHRCRYVASPIDGIVRLLFAHLSALTTRQNYGPCVEEGVVAKDKDLPLPCANLEIIQRRTAGPGTSFVPTINDISHFPPTPLKGKCGGTFMRFIAAVTFNIYTVENHG